MLFQTSHLPAPNPEELTLSQKLTDIIRAEMMSTGFVSFARYMELALYTPEWGYYMNTLPKFGAAGDFITAPEISTLFAVSLARQIQSVLNLVPRGDLLEIGAGSGCLAMELLKALKELNTLPEHYYIIEISPFLRRQQQVRLQEEIPELYDRLIWLDTLPDVFNGIILANEVLDAMPVERFCYRQEQLYQVFVTWDEKEKQFVEAYFSPNPELQAMILELPVRPQDYYCSEIHQTALIWLEKLIKCLKKGLILIIDYGYPRHEYYHVQRDEGTLICHYRHHRTTDPYWMPGLQDITASVDFTAIAMTAIKHQLEVSGYTTQNYFLLGCGILEIMDNRLSKLTSFDAETCRWQQQTKKLLMPGEMGEHFKVMALARDLTEPFIGFSVHNMQDKL